MGYQVGAAGYDSLGANRIFSGPVLRADTKVGDLNVKNAQLDKSVEQGKIRASASIISYRENLS